MIVPLAFAFTSLVEGETCPAPEAVEPRVRAILQLPPTRELTEGFVVERREAGLFVELRSAEGATIGQRTLPKEGTCEELAQAAAVVLSAWLNDAHPDFAGALPEPSVVEPSQAEPQAPPPASPSPPQQSQTPPPKAAPQRVLWPYRWELGLGVGADVSGEVAAAGTLRAAVLPIDSGLGLSVTALIDATRSHRLGDGEVIWRRWPLALAPTWRWSERAWQLDASLGPALAWLHFVGQGFEPDKRQDGVTWAGYADLRIASRGKLGFWGGLSALAYFAQSTAYIGDGVQRYSLPPVAVAAWVGGRFAP